MQETLVQFLGLEESLEKARLSTLLFLGFPGGSDGIECACNVGVMGLQIPWRRAWQPTPVFLPGESPREA